MWYIGIDLHRHSLTVAAVHDSGEVRPPMRFATSETAEIRDWFAAMMPFRCVIEATGTYR